MHTVDTQPKINSSKVAISVLWITSNHEEKSHTKMSNMI